MTIVAKVVRIDVGAQLVHGRLARLVTLFDTEAGGSVCTAFDREHYLRLIQALNEYMHYSHSKLADIDDRAGKLHAEFQRRPPVLTQDRIEGITAQECVTHLHGRATLERLALDLTIDQQVITVELPAPMVDVLVGYVLSVFEQFDPTGQLLTAPSGKASH